MRHNERHSRNDGGGFGRSRFCLALRPLRLLLRRVDWNVLECVGLDAEAARGRPGATPCRTLAEDCRGRETPLRLDDGKPSRDASHSTLRRGPSARNRHLLPIRREEYETDGFVRLSSGGLEASTALQKRRPLPRIRPSRSQIGDARDQGRGGAGGCAVATMGRHFDGIGRRRNQTDGARVT